jgi:hypothetical protein
VWFPVFEEPSVRGGREETKTNENNYCNQNSYSERNHAAPLVFAALCPVADAGQHTGMTNQPELSGHTLRLSLQSEIPHRGQVNGRRCKDGANIREDGAPVTALRSDVGHPPQKWAPL